VGLKAAVKRAVAQPTVWRATSALRAPGWVVLTYHRIGAAGEPMTHLPASVFRDQMRWIRANCDVIDPQSLSNRAPGLGRRRPAVLVTFDDGYRNYLEHACPVLREFDIRAINFLPTRYVDESRPFWWDLVDTAARTTRCERAVLPATDGRMIDLDQDGRRRFARHCKNVLKKIASPDQSPILDEALAALGFGRAEVPLSRQVMTWDEVRAASDVTTVGAHTHTHPIMSLLDPRSLDQEIAVCSERISAELGARPRFFAYPSGAFNDDARMAVQRAGYEVAFTTVEGFNTGTIDWLTLNRMHARPTLPELAWMLTGWDLRMTVSNETSS